MSASHRAKPPLPASAQRKRPRGRAVMDNAEFCAALAAVIERDFFPDLPLVRHQAAAAAAAAATMEQDEAVDVECPVSDLPASVDAFHATHTAHENAEFQERAKHEELARRTKSEANYGQLDRANVTSSLPPLPPVPSPPTVIQNNLMFTPKPLELPSTRHSPTAKAIRHSNTRFHSSPTASPRSSREFGGALFPSSFDGEPTDWATESTEITAILGTRGKRKALQAGLPSPIGTRRCLHQQHWPMLSAPQSPDTPRTPDRVRRRKSTGGRVEADLVASPSVQGIFAAGRSSRAVRSTPSSPASPISKSSPRGLRRIDLRNLSDAAQRLAIRIADSSPL